MRALIDLSRTWDGYSSYTNIFRAARTWFGDEYESVKHGIIDMYLDYYRTQLSQWGDRVALSNINTQLRSFLDEPIKYKKFINSPFVNDFELKNYVDNFSFFKKNSDNARLQWDQLKFS